MKGRGSEEATHGAGGPGKHIREFRRRFDEPLKCLSWRSTVLLGQLGLSRIAAPMNGEFNEVENRRADLIARLEGGGILHMEFQSAPAVGMAWRMVNYRRLIRQHLDALAPLRQIVVFVGNEDIGRWSASIEDGQLQFRCEVKDIRDMDPDAFLDSPSIDDNVFAILCRGGEDPARIRRLVGKLGALRGAERVDAIAKLGVLAGLRDLADRIVKEAPMPMVQEIKENPFFKTVYQEGEREGERKGERKRVAKILSALDYEVPLAVLELVEDADEDTLDRIMAAAIRSRSLDEFLEKAGIDLGSGRGAE